MTASLNSGAVANAIDSSLATRWDPGQNVSAGDWFKIDLGAAVAVDRVDFSSYTDANDYPPSYTVQLSTDNVTFGAAVATGSGAGFTSAAFTAQTARYILLTCTAASSFYWSIHDLNVYGTPRGATLASSASLAALTLGKGAVTQGAGASLTLTGAYRQSAGTFTGSSSGLSVGGTFDVLGGTFTAGSGAVSVTGAATVSGAGTVNAGSSTSFTFANTFAIGPGTFNAGSAGADLHGRRRPAERRRLQRQHGLGHLLGGPRADERHVHARQRRRLGPLDVHAVDDLLLGRDPRPPGGQGRAQLVADDDVDAQRTGDLERRRLVDAAQDRL